MHYQCLIVDDEETLASSTAEYFNLYDITTAYVTTIEEARSFLEGNDIEVLLLDINLGQTSGFEFCKELRKELKFPILFISARTSDEDQITALHIGGDDYIKKPYSLSVILAKVQAVLKRYGKTQTETQVFISGKLKIDYDTKRVYVEDNEIKLQTLEYKLLCYLIGRKNCIVSKEELFQKVWESPIISDGTLNVHIRHLREKIEADPNKPKWIITVWGRGYLFEDRC